MAILVLFPGRSDGKAFLSWLTSASWLCILN